MGVERRVLRHRCSKKGGCVERTEGSGSSKRAQPRKGAPSPACGSVCVPAKGRHLSLSTFWQIWHLPHPRGGSAPSYAYKILFWINFCSSPTRLSVFEMCNPSALPQFLYSYHFSSTLSIFAFLFFIASFEALFLSRFSLHSLTKSHANRSTCVCMRARVLQKRVCVLCECGCGGVLEEKRSSPGSPSWQEADQQDLVHGQPESLSCVSENRHVV